MRSTPSWKWALGWVITPVFLVLFLSTLCVFHILQVIAGTFSRRAQKHVLDVMNVTIVWIIRFVSGARYEARGAIVPDDGRPLIVVANHQSMYDIPMIMWIYRKREVAFISKKELARGIPSVSYALRTLGSALIDRKDAKQAVRAIEEFGNSKERAGQVACIFPEGTRARDGIMKRFKSTGFLALIRSMPSARIQPVVVDGNWELLRFKFLPVPAFTTARITLLDPLEPGAYPPQELVRVVEGAIRRSLGQEESSSGVAEAGSASGSVMAEA